MRKSNLHAGRSASGSHGSVRAPRLRREGKLLVALLGTLAALAMVVAGVGAFFLTKERESRQAKERQLELALAESAELRGQIGELQQDKSRVEDELGRARKELAQSRDEAAKATAAQVALAQSVEDREREIGRLTKDLEQVRNEAMSATGQVTELQTERDAMKQQVTDLERAKGELESKVIELSGRPTVELDKVLVNDRPGAVVGAATPVNAVLSALPDGQVVVVNREYDFIVVNLGKNHGLSVGQEFQVVRGGSVLGRVKVEKVYDELSAAAILPESQKEDIREGDVVRAL